MISSRGEGEVYYCGVQYLAWGGRSLHRYSHSLSDSPPQIYLLSLFVRFSTTTEFTLVVCQVLKNIGHCIGSMSIRTYSTLKVGKCLKEKTIFQYAYYSSFSFFLLLYLLYFTLSPFRFVANVENL